MLACRDLWRMGYEAESGRRNVELPGKYIDRRPASAMNKNALKFQDKTLLLEDEPMKIMFASDIHGSAVLARRRLLDIWKVRGRAYWSFWVTYCTTVPQ